jgi:hypothetical protein
MPTSFFFGSMTMVRGRAQNITITASDISNTCIDMNTKRITTVGDPVESQDAVTKWYADTMGKRIARDVMDEFSGVMIRLVGDCFVPALNLRPGSYIVTVIPIADGGPTATFSVSKSSVYSIGSATRISATPGTSTFEQIEILWNPDEWLSIRKTGLFHDGDYLINTDAKNISTISGPPVLPTDQASKAYVDNALQTIMKEKFGGIQVHLEGIDFVAVAPLLNGSYVLAVTPINISGAPTASFSISKNSTAGSANIQKSSSCIGIVNGETLEITWNSNSPLMLRKTGPGYNGEYLVDFNLKNFSTVPSPVLPSDTVSRDYLDCKIQELLEYKFCGVKVFLMGTSVQNVENLTPGSYALSINSLVIGGPTATFHISKNSSFNDATSIVRVAFSPGMDTGEELQVLWNANSMLQIKKTKPYHDGEYRVDFNLKNVGSAIPTIDSDVATKEYCDFKIKQALDVDFSGLSVLLQDTEFSVVCTPRLGSYVITVSPFVSGGATATFMVSKASLNGNASIIRTTNSSADSTGEQIELAWNADQPLLLRKTGPFHDGNYLVDFNLKNFSSTPAPTIPTDIATVSYVENLLNNRLNIDFGGQLVSLVDDTAVQVVALKAGSYTINISPTFDGGPCASFSVSKSSLYTSNASVSVISQSLGTVTGERLELFWPDNSQLLVRKTGPFHDGQYIVDFNLKNFSSIPPAVIPSDLATKAYVDHALEQIMSLRFGGINVHLLSNQVSTVAALKPGSYMVNISTTVHGGPCANFAISKSLLSESANIFQITGTNGNSGEKLELLWGPNEKLQLRKNGLFYDGVYLVDLNLKNFSSTETPVMNSDIATRDFVFSTIKNLLDAEFSGVSVSLVGSSFCQVAPLRPGSYVITVSPVLSGPTATFNISKSSTSSESFSISKSSSCQGTNGEYLELDWPLNSQLLLRKSGPFDDGEYIVDFNLRNFSAVPPAVISSDVATKSFVTNSIQQFLDVKFGGTRVFLSRDEFSIVAPLKPGSYTINISPSLDGGAAACFNISKSSIHSNASIVRTVSTLGIDFNEELDLVWNESSQLLLRKTRVGNDMEYIVDLNLKNFTLSDSVVSTDVATRDFVITSIKEFLDVKFGGVQVSLVSNSFAFVAPLNPGSYTLNISPLSNGGATASFSISKSSVPETMGSIYRITGSSGKFSEDLELSWNESGELLLRKNKVQNDMTYLVDFNLKNFTPTTFPIIDSALASKTYVDMAISNLEQTKFSGSTVSLGGVEFVDVIDLAAGSYQITVSTTGGGPTASFSVSKSTLDGFANIAKTTSSLGANSTCSLELVWSPNVPLQLRKTTNEFNGMYVVNFNLINQTVPTPVVPTNVASKDYVDSAIKTIMQSRFSGIPVIITGTDFFTVAPLEPGSYNITVSSLVSGAPVAAFSVSKSTATDIAQVTITSRHHGSDTLCNLELVWESNEPVKIKKNRNTFDGVYTVNFNLLTQQVPVPVVASNVVSLDYLEQRLAQVVETKFSGITVALYQTDFFNVVNLASGSYQITVSSTVIGGPTASYSISKSMDDDIAQINVLTRHFGSDSKTNLELIWDSDSYLQLKKTSSLFDGNYIVNFNLINQTVPAPVVPTNVVSKEYLAQQLENLMQLNFSGLEISLVGINFTNIMQLGLGSYTVNISSGVDGGPTASFSISKSNSFVPGMVVQVSRCPGILDETLELVWETEWLQLRKSKNTADGKYIVNLNLLNTLSPNPIINRDDGIIRVSLTLSGTRDEVVYNLEPASYIVMISTRIGGGAPTATFSVSKGIESIAGTIDTITSSFPVGCSLVLSWNPNQPLAISKNGNTFDGSYNLKIL